MPALDGGAAQELLYADDPLWHDATLRAFDPRTVAWVESNKKAELAPYLSGRPPGPTEMVKVSYPSPDRAELEATLESPGLVVLADVDYPGWKLTIDGKRAPIYVLNRLMRGAAVTAGNHRLIFAYEPRSFLIGRVASVIGLVVFAVLAIACARRPVDPLIGFCRNVD